MLVQVVERCLSRHRETLSESLHGSCQIPVPATGFQITVLPPTTMLPTRIAVPTGRSIFLSMKASTIAAISTNNATKAAPHNEISDTNIIIYCNVLIFLFAFIVALYLPTNFLEQTSYFAASLDQPLLNHLLLHFRTVENLVLASF